MNKCALLGMRVMIAVATCLLGVPLATAGDDTLTREQIREFLLTAKIVGAKESTKGVTRPARLTLSDGKITHDASYQRINEHKPASGTTELNFVDSYKYNLAAYAWAEMLAVEDMLPVYVERSYQGDPGSLSWWLPVKMDEAECIKKPLGVRAKARENPPTTFASGSCTACWGAFTQVPRRDL